MASALLTRAAATLVNSGVSGESALAFVLVEADFSGLGIGCTSVASTPPGPRSYAQSRRAWPRAF
ncbi:MAG: hypothetical protein M3309_07875 [Actinomycetota bacterium]|nr:hypothetical protein [Actinomycetota bacterium]